ncbi:iron donor protein CyaY [Lacisediminimonas profundi]|uniref:iron donor protein CyaY n=1 Tax=Lacisediminimonas profundi TaxID=2603856 RepID=UPI00124AE5F6|nr:iron donor protein CyaY [Lacisediminimonas profundi]
MTESEFLALAESTLAAIEAAAERLADQDDLDLECSRRGNVLEIELPGNGGKVIINSQAPMQEMWVAARSGGFHYRQQEGRWIDTRSGAELFEALSKILSAQAGQPVVLAPG